MKDGTFQSPGAGVFISPDQGRTWERSREIAGRCWAYRRMLTDFPGMLAYPDGAVDEAEEYLRFAFDCNRHDVIYWEPGRREDVRSDHGGGVKCLPEYS